MKRQILCKKKHFEPYVAYKSLETSPNQGISQKRLKTLLTKSRLSQPETAIRAFIRSYKQVPEPLGDSEDQILVYKDFLEIVLPRDNCGLRASVTQKDCFNFDQNEEECAEIELEIAELIENEINLLTRLSRIRQRLITLKISALDLVTTISGSETAPINFHNLKRCLVDFGLSVYDNEIVCFLRRIGRDEDGVVSAEEIARFLNLVGAASGDKIKRFEVKVKNQPQKSSLGGIGAQKGQNRGPSGASLAPLASIGGVERGPRGGHLGGTKSYLESKWKGERGLGVKEGGIDHIHSQNSHIKQNGKRQVLRPSKYERGNKENSAQFQEANSHHLPPCKLPKQTPTGYKKNSPPTYYEKLKNPKNSLMRPGVLSTPQNPFKKQKNASYSKSKNDPKIGEKSQNFISSSTNEPKQNNKMNKENYLRGSSVQSSLWGKTKMIGESEVTETSYSQEPTIRDGLRSGQEVLYDTGENMTTYYPKYDCRVSHKSGYQENRYQDNYSNKPHFGGYGTAEGLAGDLASTGTFERSPSDYKAGDPGGASPGVERRDYERQMGAESRMRDNYAKKRQEGSKASNTANSLKSNNNSTNSRQETNKRPSLSKYSQGMARRLTTHSDSHQLHQHNHQMEKGQNQRRISSTLNNHFTEGFKNRVGAKNHKHSIPKNHSNQPEFLKESVNLRFSGESLISRNNYSNNNVSKTSNLTTNNVSTNKNSRVHSNTNVDHSNHSIMKSSAFEDKNRQISQNSGFGNPGDSMESSVQRRYLADSSAFVRGSSAYQNGYMDQKESIYFDSTKTQDSRESAYYHRHGHNESLNDSQEESPTKENSFYESISTKRSESEDKSGNTTQRLSSHHLEASDCITMRRSDENGFEKMKNMNKIKNEKSSFVDKILPEQLKESGILAPEHVVSNSEHEFYDSEQLNRQNGPNSYFISRSQKNNDLIQSVNLEVVCEVNSSPKGPFACLKQSGMQNFEHKANLQKCHSKDMESLTITLQTSPTFKKPLSTARWGDLNSMFDEKGIPAEIEKSERNEWRPNFETNGLSPRDSRIENKFLDSEIVNKNYENLKKLENYQNPQNGPNHSSKADNSSNLVSVITSLKNSSVKTLKSSLKIDISDRLFQFSILVLKILEEERLLEIIKQNLASNPDFNMKKIFDMINQSKDGKFKYEDFRVFLGKLGISNTNHGILIDLFSSFDRDKICELGFDELIEMIYPFNDSFALNMHKDCQTTRSNDFSKKTMLCLARTFKSLISLRKTVQEVKSELRNRRIDLDIVFEEIDLTRRGYLLKVDFERLFSIALPNFKESPAEELGLFVRRIDIDKDTRINYRDFYLFFSL